MAGNPRWIGKPISRLDAREKVLGQVKYMTDLSFPDMLFAQAVRSPYPHALIKGIDKSKAEKLPGVIKVLTHEDVPGLNVYGIVIPDQPVLCEDRVRFKGEPVALVVAESLNLAIAGAKLVEVEYEPFPPVDDLFFAMQDAAVKLHKDGNVHLHTHVKNGDAHGQWEKAAVIVENTYLTPRQLHGYLETEAGVGLIDPDGQVVVYCGGHYPNRDQRQIARVLGIAEKKVRIISAHVGGGFGGKDEVTLQAQLALAAYSTGRPVKIVHTREESFLAGQKKHPMLIKMKTAADKRGKLLANKVEIYADTGAYASLGGPIVNLAVEHACGVYRVPHVEIDGYCVYTNNGVSGPMRGFGVNQVTFAMETQMELLAAKLGLDRAEIRRKNILKTGHITPLGNKAKGALGTHAVLDILAACPEWVNREKWKKESKHPFKARGIGMGLSIQGVGLGKGLPDFSRARIEYLAGERYRVFAGNPDVGQGNKTALAQIAAEALGCDLGQVEIVLGDTGLTPDSGSSTASRSIYATGNAIIDAAEKLKTQLNTNLEKGDLVSAEGYFHFPVASRGVEGALGLPHYIFSAMGHLAMVEVNTLTGEVEVVKVVAVPDAGKVINPQGIEGQCEGGAVMGLGYALMEDFIIEGGNVITENLSLYHMPTAQDSPKIITVFSEGVPEPTGPFGAKGIGEAVCVPVTPAITNAIMDALGSEPKHLPLTPERIYRMLHPDLER